MALVHDLAESIVGDLTPSSGVSKQDKYAQEKVRKFTRRKQYTNSYSKTQLPGAGITSLVRSNCYESILRDPRHLWD